MLCYVSFGRRAWNSSRLVFTHGPVQGDIRRKPQPIPLTGERSAVEGRKSAMRVPSSNADELPEVELTEEQRYLFDTRGWLMIPGVLTPKELQPMREFCYRLKQEPESIPPHHRSSIGGPLERLVDHPVVLGFM